MNRAELKDLAVYGGTLVLNGAIAILSIMSVALMYYAYVSEPVALMVQ